MPHGIQLKKGEVFWFNGGENPFFSGTPLGEGFSDYNVVESGLIYYEGMQRPYFLILETDYRSEYEEYEDNDDGDWPTHVSNEIDRHKVSFKKFGWNFEESLP